MLRGVHHLLCCRLGEWACPPAQGCCRLCGPVRLAVSVVRDCQDAGEHLYRGAGEPACQRVRDEALAARGHRVWQERQHGPVHRGAGRQRRVGSEHRHEPRSAASDPDQGSDGLVRHPVAALAWLPSVARGLVWEWAVAVEPPLLVSPLLVLRQVRAY